MNSKIVLLDETALENLPENKRSVFILDWLIHLDQNLLNAKNTDVKDIQKGLVEQLVKQIHNSPGPPVRKLIGSCLANLFNIGDAFLLFDTVNTCNDILKNKDDSPSFLPTKLACITCIGAMYEKLGRLMGRSYQETVTHLLKSLKNAESQLRCEIYITLRKIVVVMSSAASALHRDIFKAIKHGLTDRVLAVRTSSAQCLLEMLQHAVFLYTTDLENVFSICFRSLEGSNYEVRCEIAKVLGTLVLITQTTHNLQPGNKTVKLATLDEVLNLLGAGFTKGSLGGFLKTGEMIKGNFSVNKEVRVGVTHAYVNAVEFLGTVWLERNLPTVFNHLLELLPNLKASSTHMDTVYSRRCIFYILLTLSKSLNEKAQIQSIKVLITILNKYRLQPQTDNSIETIKELLICILLVIGCIFEDLSTCSTSFINENNSKVIEIISSLLVYPIPFVRTAAAWCLRCIALASPSHLTLLIDKCLEQLEKQTETSPEIIHGYSFALSALIGVACQTPLGMPHSKGKLIFCVAEDCIRSASQNSRLAQHRIQSGWQLIGSIMTLDTSFVRILLPRLMLIWKNSFPRTDKDLESEKSIGIKFTWQVTLEHRAGALAAISSFITHNRSLVTEDIIDRLLPSIENAILMLVNSSAEFKNLGASVKASSAMVRLRLYEILLLIPANKYERSLPNLLRLLVSEFTLAENVASTTTSLLRNICHPDNEVVLGTWIQDTDHKLFEDQFEPNRKNLKEFLQPSNAGGSGALEHDITYLYKRLEDSNELTPSPLPLGVAIIDKSCLLYAHVFKYTANLHKLQMLNHFQDCIKHAKVARQEAIQMNILTVLISSLKVFVENKVQFGTERGEEIRKTIYDLLFSMLTHNNPLLRCAAGKGLGRLCQISSDGRYVSEITQNVLEKLKVARDMYTRTGYSLALGYLHRFVGSLGSNQNLNTAISLLLALSQDLTSPAVQLWALHGLTLIVDSGGPMFRSYIDITLQHALKLLNTVPSINSDVHHCIGKLLSALITTIGPELQMDSSNAINSTRQSLIISCFIMKAHSDPLVQTEAISCFQQMHLFAPTYIDLSYLVPSLCSILKSSHLFLRKAAVSCLYQLSQREAKEVCDHAAVYLNSLSNGCQAVNNSSASNNLSLTNQQKLKKSINADNGLAGLLFRFLDEEQDQKLIEDVQKIITSLVYSLTNSTQLNQIISLCKEVLTSSESNSLVSSPVNPVDKEDNDFDDDETGFNMGSEKSVVETITPRWKTKVFAIKILSCIIIYCENSPISHLHFNLAKAREAKELEKQNNYLVLHLSDLIRMAFMAATSENDSLRLEGLRALNLIIVKFANVPEPEFQDHVILEQYQAQVAAALRPAFSSDTASHVTASACSVCSTWIGSGVARDLNDLKRVHQLLVSSLSKLEKDSSCTIYNESSITLEKLAILKAWAEVYIVAMKKEDEKIRLRKAKLSRKNSTVEDDDEDNEIEFISANNEDLLQLVKPELKLLSENWLAALKDAAFLTLPSEFSRQLPHDGGTFYSADTIELARPQYRKSWSPILHASCLWLSSTGFDMYNERNDEEQNKRSFYLLFGIAMEALCDPKSNEPISYITEALGSLKALLLHKFTREILSKDINLSIELCNVLHRLLITREILQCQQIVLDISHLIVKSQLEALELETEKRLKENDNKDKIDELIAELGEKGNENGELERGQSLAYALAELTLCVLIRQLPELSPQLLANKSGLSSVILNQRKASNHFETKVNNENAKLIGSATHLLTLLPNLCNAKTSVSILPTVLFLLTGVLKESSEFINNQSKNDQLDLHNEIEPFLSVVNGLKNLCLSKFVDNQSSKSQWIQLLQSTLARILDICKSNDGTRPNDMTILVIVGTFVLEAPSEVIKPPNLKFPCMNLIKHFLDSNKVNVQLKCLETIRKIFTHKNRSISYSYIHSLAPDVVSLINNEIDSSLTTKLTRAKYRLITNGLEIIGLLVELAEKKLNLLMIYLPLLMKLLVDDLNEIKSKPFSVMLHNYALDKLTKIGPIYSNEFKQIIGQVPIYRNKLENAIKQKQNASNEQKKLESNQLTQSNSSTMIKLKTDFSNYN